MAILSLNGNFNYPIELKQDLTLDGAAVFNSAISQGFNNNAVGQYSFVHGNSCSANSIYSIACGRESYVSTGSDYSIAFGESCSAYGANSCACGHKSSTKNIDGDFCENTFVWQGNRGGNQYVSMGSGTFCINPKYPFETSEPASSVAICGFFVGENCITDYMSSAAAKRILTNENYFTELQRFSNGSVFDGTVTFNPNSQTVFEGSVIFNGSTSASLYNTTDIIRDDDGIANHRYVNGMSLSAVLSVGQYYDTDISKIDFDGMSEWSTPLKFVKSYVTSAVNDVDAFKGDEPPSSAAASIGYVDMLATSASTHALTSDNIFTGENVFRNIVRISNTLETMDSGTVDFRKGEFYVSEPTSIETFDEYSASTIRFTRSVATSAVTSILNGDNVYTGTNNYLSSNVYIRNPLVTSINENEPSTTYFSRYVATSAINNLLENGGTFDGTVSFNKSINLIAPSGVELYVKTQNPGDSSNKAASTEFVKGAIGGAFDLFDVKFTDHKLSENSRWRMSGSIVRREDFPEAYDHIYEEYQNGKFVEEKIGDVKIVYFMASDGHRIVYGQSNISALNNIFKNTGIAWFYILDTSEKYIILPKSSYNFNIIQSTGVVGSYVAPSLPSHSHTAYTPIGSGAGHGGCAHHGENRCGTISVSVNDNLSYGNVKIGTTVQPPATNMFLYFYCG